MIKVRAEVAMQPVTAVDREPLVVLLPPQGADHLRHLVDGLVPSRHETLERDRLLVVEARERLLACAADVAVKEIAIVET